MRGMMAGTTAEKEELEHSARIECFQEETSVTTPTIDAV